MSARTFADASALDDSGLALALAPALTPDGIDDDPSFFHGFATYPVVIAQGLLALADITGTRYGGGGGPTTTPSLTTINIRDPILSAHGDRLRAEVFSTCNSVYARLDVLASGLDGGEIGRGTTNVDINLPTRIALSKIRRSELLHLDVGIDGLRASTPTNAAVERPVTMPDRWVRALGNAAELHHDLAPVFSLDRLQARQFIAGLPHLTARTERGWLVADRSGARLSRREVPDSVFVSGLHRLDVLRRLMLHVTGLTAYSTGGGVSSSLIEVELPGARLTLGLTADVTRGYSGEGALLPQLGGELALDDARLVSGVLSFEPVIDIDLLTRETALSTDRVRGALAVLASSGRVGWDAHSRSWFHRELPDKPDRIERDNPRLRGARQLLAEGRVLPGAAADEWMVGEYRVRLAADPGSASAGRCTCTWYLSHGTDRGLCKHLLAAQLASRAIGRDGAR